jgi:hypothetical protein
MDARPVKVSRWERHLDRLFGRVESFEQVQEYRVQIQVGSALFISNRTYPTAVAALRAARRLSAKDTADA